MKTAEDDPKPMTLTNGRLCIFAAACLWSLSGFFSKVLTQPTWIEEWWQLGFFNASVAREDVALWIAFYRALFAGLVLSTLVRYSDVRFSALLLVMGCSFAVMNATYVLAMVFGTAANAVLLQYTSAMWLYLASVFLLGEETNWKNTVVLASGLTGVGIIIFGGWNSGDNLAVIGLGLLSGVAYAGVLICLRVLRTGAPAWLTAWNHLCGAIVIAPFLFAAATPNYSQLILLILFGALQLGMPYFLMARGLQVVNPQEAGAITLLEPILTAVFAYVTAGEAPGVYTYIGAVFILGGLTWRYWPRRKTKQEPDKSILKTPE